MGIVTDCFHFQKSICFLHFQSQLIILDIFWNSFGILLEFFWNSFEVVRLFILGILRVVHGEGQEGCRSMVGQAETNLEFAKNASLAGQDALGN